MPAMFIFLKNKTLQDGLYYTSIVKDDVFFAPSTEMCLNTITHMPTPCLSPVTSPSDFLYEKEPLFDGIENYLVDEQQDSDYDLLPSTPSTTTSAGDDEDIDSLCHTTLFKLNSDKITLFEQLTQAGIDWCRYCGTTEGVNWRPGPWGKRTLCNKHGCDYKGYGLASRLPRLDLSAFANESLQDRKRPIVQQFCVLCQSSKETQDDLLVFCDGGCSRAYHQRCYSLVNTEEDWYCNSNCVENKQRLKVGK
ncbi:unnamed protein product [Rhizopus stolonifer]